MGGGGGKLKRTWELKLLYLKGFLLNFVITGVNGYLLLVFNFSSYVYQCNKMQLRGKTGWVGENKLGPS